jgi:hypothetical protein
MRHGIIDFGKGGSSVLNYVSVEGIIEVRTSLRQSSGNVHLYTVHYANTICPFSLLIIAFRTLS